MGVYTRPGASGAPIYWINFLDQHGERCYERVGANRAEADTRLAQRKRELRHGTFSREHRTGDVTLAKYAVSWGKARTNVTARDDRSRLRDHVLPVLGKLRLREVRPRHVADLIFDPIGSEGK